MLISFKYPPGDLQTNLAHNKELQRSNVNIMLNPRRPLLYNGIKCTEIYIFFGSKWALSTPLEKKNVNEKSAKKAWKSVGYLRYGLLHK